MAQRNPMNERYLGDGPSGKTKKSAASLKPKSAAAASVHVEKKPATAKERKAAQRRKDADRKRKEDAHATRVAERERQSRVDAGLESEQEQKKGFMASLFPGGKTAQDAHANDTSSQAEGTASAGAASGLPEDSITVKVKKLRRIYRGLLITAVIAIAISFALQLSIPAEEQPWYLFALMGVAYAAAISGFVLDFAKIRPMTRKYQQQVEGGKKSPKQLKHEQEAAANALEMQRARDAEKASKRTKLRPRSLDATTTQNSDKDTHKDSSDGASEQVSQEGQDS